MLTNFHIYQCEDRYRMDSVDELRKRLGEPTEYYQMTTIYAKQLEAVKFRLRRYNDEKQWYFEIKRRLQGVVEKFRYALESKDLVRWPLSLKPLFGITCYRTAYELGDTRLTVDEKVSVHRVDELMLFYTQEEVGQLPGYVVEVKRRCQLPSYLGMLSPFLSEDFSKSRAAQEILNSGKKVEEMDGKPETDLMLRL